MVYIHFGLHLFLIFFCCYMIDLKLLNDFCLANSFFDKNIVFLNLVHCF